MKAFKLILILLCCGIGVMSQNDTIGEFIITKMNNEYYLILDTHAVLIDSSTIMIEFDSATTLSEIQQFENQHGLTRIYKSLEGYYWYQWSAQQDYISSCGMIHNDAIVSSMVVSCLMPVDSYHATQPSIPQNQYYLAISQIIEAWEITKGSVEVTVAILDIGIHTPQVYGSQQIGIENIFHNPGEDEWSNWQDPVSGNGIDNDANDLVDDWKGWDFVSNDNDISTIWPRGDWFSGLIASFDSPGYLGIAGGDINTGKGGVKILPLKVGTYLLDINTNNLYYVVNLSAVENAIEYAISMGAEVICMPWGIDTWYSHQQLVGGITTAISKNWDKALFIAPSKNYQASTYTFPANLGDVMAVVATDEDDLPMFTDPTFFNISTSEIAAPGVDIMVIDKFAQTGFTEFSGTEFASAIVSGIAAMVKSVIPDIHIDDLRLLIQETADPPPSNSAYYQEYVINNNWHGFYGKGRINAHEAVCEGLRRHAHWKFAQNDTWDTPRISFNDIVVTNEKTLTITSELQMGDGARIIVHPGSRLIINGGTITNCQHCNNTGLWGGVEVWGSKSHDQSYGQDGMPEHQGEVIILNGGTITNAEIGILAMKRDDDGGFIANSGGGIVKAIEANFINNRVAIKIGDYYNYASSYFGSFNYMSFTKSQITNCYFETNNDFNSNNEFWSFIELSDGSGLSIRGNQIINNSTDIPLNKRGRGIVSYDFPISVRSICSDPTQNPCQDYNNNTFSGLLYGIEVFNTKTWVTHTIKNSVFENCHRGIYLGNTHSAAILENTFNIPHNYSLDPYGLYLEGGNGFTVEGNIFSTSAPGHNRARGLIVQNTGGYDNEIYRNEFHNLLAGVQAQEVNKGSGSSNGKGLRFFCNTHDNKYYDFWVGNKYQTNNSPIGIAEGQVYSLGATKYPAGNVFTSGSRFGDLDFSNGQAEFLTYFYLPASIQKETPEKYSGITLYPIPNPNTCPAKSTGGSGSSLGQLYTSRASARVALNSSTLILNIWKDGGNIELGEEVAATLPWDAYEMFNDLMGNSPYLSEEVLISAIENIAFSSLMIKLLMIANPHSTRSDEVMSALYERNPPLPETYIQEITGELGTVSQLDLLAADVAADRHMYNNLGEQIKRLYRSDTTHAWAMDSLLNFLGQDDQLGSRYELAFVQLESGYPALALSTLDEIPSQFDLNESEQANHDDFVYLHNIREQMIESSGSTGFLTENQINTMEGMLEANRPQVAAIAVALLCKNDPELVYNEIVLEPDTNSVPKRIIAVRDKIKEPLFNIYPNPAYSQVIIAYDVSDIDYRMLKAEIYNIQGKIVKEKTLDVNALQARIDLQSLSPGKYLVRLVGDGRVLGTEKLSIGR